MAIYPDLDDQSLIQSTAQRRFYIAWHTLLILLFLIILVIVIMNVWQILILQQRWKTPPLLLFYIFALIVVISRIVNAVLPSNEDQPYSLENLLCLFICYSAPIAKLAVGAIQLWMMVELTIGLKTSIQLAEDPHAKVRFTKSCRSKAQAIYLTTVVVIYLGLLSYEIYACFNPESVNLYRFEGILGFSFLTAFILLAIVNLYFIVQLKKFKKLIGHNSALFEKERLSILITFVLFDLGYLLRFFWDEWGFWLTEYTFPFYVVQDFVMMTDAFTLLALVILHRQNFLRGTTNQSRHAQPELITISPLQLEVTRGSILERQDILGQQEGATIESSVREGLVFATFISSTSINDPSGCPLAVDDTRQDSLRDFQPSLMGEGGGEQEDYQIKRRSNTYDFINIDSII